MDKLNTNNFDFLRIVFASTVAISHLMRISEVDTFQLYQGFFNARLAIDGFFIISGFLIAKSYENTSSIKTYLIKRVKRIVPAYFFLILLCAILFSFISSYSFYDYFANTQFWKYLAANLTFQNYLEPCLPGVFINNEICTVNASLWTIKIEEAFYLLIPVFYWLINLKRINVNILYLLIYLSSIMYFNYFVHIDAYRIAKQLPGALAFFIVGIFLYRNFLFFNKYKHYIVLPCILLFLLEQFVFNTHLLKPITYGFMVYYLAYSFKYLNNFGKYGDFTYGIYIYHFPILQIFMFYGLFEKHNPVIVATLFLVLVLILSILSWHFLEIRFLSRNRMLRYKKLGSLKF